MNVFLPGLLVLGEGRVCLLYPFLQHPLRGCCISTALCCSPDIPQLLCHWSVKTVSLWQKCPGQACPTEFPGLRLLAVSHRPGPRHFPGLDDWPRLLAVLSFPAWNPWCLSYPRPEVQECCVGSSQCLGLVSLNKHSNPALSIPPNTCLQHLALTLWLSPAGARQTLVGTHPAASSLALLFPLSFF